MTFYLLRTIFTGVTKEQVVLCWTWRHTSKFDVLFNLSTRRSLLSVSSLGDFTTGERGYGTHWI